MSKILVRHSSTKHKEQGIFTSNLGCPVVLIPFATKNSYKDWNSSHSYKLHSNLRHLLGFARFQEDQNLGLILDQLPALFEAFLLRDPDFRGFS